MRLVHYTTNQIDISVIIQLRDVADIISRLKLFFSGSKIYF